MKFVCHECLEHGTAKDPCILDVGSDSERPEFCPYDDGFLTNWYPEDNEYEIP